MFYELNDQYYSEDLISLYSQSPLSIDEIIGVHGYRFVEAEEETTIQRNILLLKNVKITSQDQKNIIFFDEIYVSDFQLICVKKVNHQIKSKNKIKFEIFKAKDEAEKIGGEKTKLCVICNSNETDALENELSEIPRINLKNRIKVLNSEDLNESEIEYFVKEL